MRAREGWLATASWLLGLAVSLYALYWVLAIVPAQVYRPTFLLLALVLAFLLYPARRVVRARVTAADGLCIALAAGALLWPVVQGQAFELRAATPNAIDLALGVALVALVLEATRRTTGPMLPVSAAVFLVYAWAGPFLDRVGLSLVAHRGYSVERIVGTLYISLEGVLGVPLDVAATYIVLFTIYGAVVERGGAGRFFLEWAMAATGGTRGGANPGRTVTVAGYLLGALCGSGVANTVTLGAVAWPLMRSAGYAPDTGGAVLAAAGIGAILAPPVMGATAFLMAEFLEVSYFDVAMMAIVPAALYYGALFLVVEADGRRLGIGAPRGERRALGTVTRGRVAPLRLVRGDGDADGARRHGVQGGVLGHRGRGRGELPSPQRCADAQAARGRAGGWRIERRADCGHHGVRRHHRRRDDADRPGPQGRVAHRGAGGRQPGADRDLSALAVWALGLAVPVTACYIIAAVMVAPALTQVGVPQVAAHMFVFYYAVLSEVSPPTALSPFAAAAITGGNPFRTTMLTWKYAPRRFSCRSRSRGRRLARPSCCGAAPPTSSAAAGMSALGVAAIALGTAGYFRRPATGVERALAIAGGVMLLSIDRRLGAAGFGLLVVAFTVHQRQRAVTSS